MNDLFTLNEATGFYDANCSVTGDDIISMADEILVERLARPSAECFQNPGDVKTFLKLHLSQTLSLSIPFLKWSYCVLVLLWATKSQRIEFTEWIFLPNF